MTWIAAFLGLPLIVLGCKVIEHRRVTAHIAAGVIFFLAGLLFMLPVLVP